METDEFDCLKEECAWWQLGDEQCAILNLTEGIADTAHWLGVISKELTKIGSLNR